VLELLRLVRRYGRRTGWTIWTYRLEQRQAERTAGFRPFAGDKPTMPGYRAAGAAGSTTGSTQQDPRGRTTAGRTRHDPRPSRQRRRRHRA
jgi:hypothetical protein